MRQQVLNRMIYLDNAATTPADPRVVEAMLPFYCSNYANPSAIHPMGVWANEAIENARQRVADLIGCQPVEIIFTSGGTEADNLAILGVTKCKNPRNCHVITSQIEHHAVLEVCHLLEKNGYRITYLPVDSYGMVSVKDVEMAINPDTVLVTIMAANNVTGTIQPFEKIGKLCRDYGVLFHTDAVQLVGHLPINIDKDNIDLLSLSAHKFNGPKGVGALYARYDVALSPLIIGGGQEEGLRSGTENVPAIVGLGVAAEIAKKEMAVDSARINKLHQFFINTIINSVPGSRLISNAEASLPNIINISFEGIESEYLAGELGKAGICVSSGSACSSGTHEAPYVLIAAGLERDLANCAIRFSLGRNTENADIEQTVKILIELIDTIRHQTKIW